MAVSTSFRVLSIQSHVVSGYVGNKCAVYPLQLLGFEVDIINSVQLSNHLGYKHWGGQVLNGEELQELIAGLKLNNIHHYSHILTGYIGSTSFLKKLAEAVKDLKSSTSSLVFVCDPVLGDDEKLYVPEEHVPIYRELVIPLADIVTPNQFEAEVLTQIKITNKQNVLQVLEWFHSRGVKVVVITSISLHEDDDERRLIGFASHSADPKDESLYEQYIFEMPKVSGKFTGTGDLFAALFMAWLAKTNGNIQVACKKTASTIYHILERTLSHHMSVSPTSEMELQLIQSKQDIENPVVVVSVQKL